MMASAAEAVLSPAPVAESVSNGAGEGARVKEKLHGRAFYESIGSPKHIVAPMVDQSEYVGIPAPFVVPIAQLVRLYG